MTTAARILIVDDEAPIRRFLRIALEAEGYAGHSKVKIFSGNNW